MLARTRAKRPLPASISALEPRRLFASVPSGFLDATVGGQISNGTSFDFAPDGRAFVLQQTGTVRVIQTNGTLNATPALTLTVDSAGERGLLGIAFDPQFASNKFIYLYHTVPAPLGGNAHNQVTRYVVNGDTIDASSALNILDLDNLSTATNHNGGAIHFGQDGKLYVTAGDNANSANAQSVTTRLGKVLRINSDGTIPSDNPATFQVRPSSSTTYTTVTPAGLNRAIWAVGLRNPYTFSINPVNGTIFINDVGENTWEEIDVGVAGSNYGWPRTEGDFSNATVGNEQFKRPLYFYQHSGSAYPSGFAISGGAFYTGSTAALQFPQTYQNKYFFGDYVNDWFASIDPTNGSGVAQFANNANGIVDLKLGQDGSLYYLQRESSAGGIVSGLRKVSVNLALAPSISQQPGDVNVDQGQPATFTVTAANATTYQWTRNGVDIVGATNPTYTIPSAQAADNAAVFRVKVGNSSGIALSNTATLSVAVDTTAPTVVSQAFDRDDSQHHVTIELSEDVAASFVPSDVAIVDNATDAPVPATITYSAPTKSITITPDTRFANGRYRVTLSGLTDAAGNALVSTPFVFGFLAGDADGNGTVDFNDLVSLAQNYNLSPKKFSEGDFDYSGTVDFNDLVILAQNYNTSLPTLVATIAAPEATTKRKTRILDA